MHPGPLLASLSAAKDLGCFQNSAVAGVGLTRIRVCHRLAGSGSFFSPLKKVPDASIIQSFWTIAEELTW